MIISKTTFVNGDTNIVSVNTHSVNMNLTKTDISVRQNSIAQQGPRGADGSSIKLYTTPKLPIVDNKVLLEFPAVGDILLNIALVYPNIDSNIITEYNCSINATNSSEVLFDSLDNLSGQYTVLSYAIIYQ